jgi:hypothetical protein
MESIWRTKPFVLLQFKGDGHDPIRRKAVPKKPPPQQSVEEKALAAPPYAGYDLHIPVSHQPDEPIDRFFTFDNHLTSYFWVDIHLTFVRATIAAQPSTLINFLIVVFLSLSPLISDLLQL